MGLRRSKREGNIRKENPIDQFYFKFQKTQGKGKNSKQKQEPKQFLFFHIRVMKVN